MTTTGMVKAGREELTAKNLIEFLKNIPAETRIVISSDEEGNAYGQIGNAELVESQKGQILILYPGKQVLACMM